MSERGRSVRRMEPMKMQICVDAADPHVLADWWAEALGWNAEPSNEAFIESMIAQGFATEADTVRHKGVLCWAAGQAINHPSDAGVPRVLFQKVPEPKTVKNRVHWDLRIPGVRQSSADDVARLIALGATEIGRGQQGPHTWVVLTDPEDNEFCI